MAITVKRELYTNATDRPVTEWRSMRYVGPTGVTRRETRSFQSQSDTSDYCEHRLSEDNGETWGEWFREQKTTKVSVGVDEYECGEVAQSVWNPVHGHYVSLRYQRLYLNGYEAATERYWRGDGSDMIDHSFLDLRDADGTLLGSQMITYEDGAPGFDEATYRTEAYTHRNIGIGESIIVLRGGDILVALNVPMSELCRVSGLDVNELCPSIPRNAGSAFIYRGKWNGETKRYDLTRSQPIYVDDRQGSRGVMEATVAELNSGKILLVFRISNSRVEEWHGRISPYAPSYKMYALSEDGGKTFSPPLPWHFDSREIVSSSSTYSILLRSEANGRLYWVGNVTDPTKNDGNWPRYPLHIVEVDEEWGVAKKDTLTEIETRRDGESEHVQLSNFNILQDRASTNLELYVAKVGQHPGKIHWDCSSWKYTITLPK